MVETVFGLAFSTANEADLARTIATRQVPANEGPRVVATANVDHVANMARNPTFRQAYKRSWAITADGMPVYLYARLRGLRVPGRITGSDLCGQILRLLNPRQHSPFFVVSTAATAERIRAEMLGRGFGPQALEFVVPPLGFESDSDYSAALLERIARHRTTHLFLGVGSPKSELWADQYRTDLTPCYVLNFGAGLDYFAGTRIRAPKLLRSSGFEWAWRLACEPRRLFHRYALNSWRFLWAVGLDLSRRSA